MIEKLTEQIEGLRSDVNVLTEQVHAKARATIDHDRLAERLGDNLAPQLETQLIPEINASEERMKQALRTQERRLEALGSKKIAEMRETLQDFIKGLDRGERIVAGIKRALTWAGIGKIAVALLPFVFAAMVWGMLVGIVAYMFGIPQIFHWAWTSFLEAEAWWSKSLVFLATTGSALGFCWLVYWSGNKAAKSLSRMMT